MYKSAKICLRLSLTQILWIRTQNYRRAGGSRPCSEGGGVSSTLALSKFNYSLLLIEEHVCYQELFTE